MENLLPSSAWFVTKRAVSAALGRNLLRPGGFELSDLLFELANAAEDVGKFLKRNPLSLGLLVGISRNPGSCVREDELVSDLGDRRFHSKEYRLAGR